MGCLTIACVSSAHSSSSIYTPMQRSHCAHSLNRGQRARHGSPPIPRRLPPHGRTTRTSCSCDGEKLRASTRVHRVMISDWTFLNDQNRHVLDVCHKYITRNPQEKTDSSDEVSFRGPQEKKSVSTKNGLCSVNPRAPGMNRQQQPT
jgi:hypothetical protein